MSEPLRILALVVPVAVATALTATVARALVARAGLAATMVAIACTASLITAIDLMVLDHYMLIEPDRGAEIALVILYSLSAAGVAALVVGHSTTRALDRLAGVAAELGQNNLDARVGELRASPELRQVGAALDLAASRISELIETERRTESARRDLITSISHDLRTPLANLRAMVEAIDDGVVDDPAVVRRYAGEMLAAVHALVAMAEDMFELSQTDATAFRSDTRTMSVSDAVDQAVDLCRRGAEVKSITVTSRLGPAGHVRCSAKLARVVHSLVDNAVRYTPDGGFVTISASTEGGGLLLAVEDTGVGLTEDQRRSVFEPFWRGDSARSSRGPGSG